MRAKYPLDYGLLNTRWHMSHLAIWKSQHRYLRISIGIGISISISISKALSLPYEFFFVKI